MMSESAYSIPASVAAENLPPLDRGKVGMVCFLSSEAAFFGTLLVAYAAYIGQSLSGPTPKQVLSLPAALVNTAFLVSSSVTVVLAATGFARGNARRFYLGLAATMLLGLCFLGGTALEWANLIGDRGLTLQTNLFGSTFFTLIGFHAGHVTLGILLMGLLMVLAAVGRLTTSRAAVVELFSWYWHFVDGVWIFIVILVYLVGR
jgi:cytochrome c oxidase subunit 3